MAHANIRASALNGWAACVGTKGFEPRQIEALAQKTAQECATDTQIPLQSFIEFSEQLVRETRDAAIPWLVGQHYDLSSLGAGVGQAIQASSTVGVALRRFVDYFSLLQDCTDIRLECDEQHATLSYRILDPDIWPRHQDALFSLGLVAQILGLGTRDSLERIEFLFEASRSDMVGQIDRVVNGPCSFNAETNMLRFPVRLLDSELRPEIAPVRIRDLNQAIAVRNRSLPLAERLAQVVYRDLDQLAIDQERVAREVGMSSRTMRRKLANEGKSFQQVLDECRMRQAMFEFQTKPALSIAEIALKLGYSEHSTFTRAFHRWTGMPPQLYRERQTLKIN